MSEQETRQPLPLPVVVQPDPMLEDRAGPFRTLIAMAGGALVVVMVLYGLSRPPEPQVAAAAPKTEQSAPAQATTGAAQQANQPAQASTTGTAPKDEGQPKQGQAQGGQRSDSATSGKATAAPSDKPEQKQ